MAAAITFFLAYWRVGLGVLVLALALWLGFWVNGRLERAKEADALEKTLADTEKALSVLRATRVLVSAQIDHSDREIEIQTREIIKYVPKYITGDCFLEPDGVRALNRARGVPGTAGGIVAPADDSHPAP